MRPMRTGSLKDEDIARVLQIGRATVERVRRRCVEEGLERALGRKEQLNRRQKRLDGQGEAHLIALACGELPESRASWTLKLLADRLVECEIVESISPETVRQTLKKNELKPWLKECWCIPPQGQRRVRLCDGRRAGSLSAPVWDNEVLVCLDETSKQQVKETRLPRPARPGAAGSYDYEYERNGVSNFFMLFAPLEGWRRVEVTDRRTKADWARVLKPTGGRGLPAQGPYCAGDGQLEHPPSLYEAFEPAEARRIAERLEIHYTPKHGSWLDMAEIEIGVMARQCLDRRIPDQSALRRGGGSVAATAQPGRNTGGLAIHHLGCAHQTKIPLPINTTLTYY